MMRATRFGLWVLSGGPVLALGLALGLGLVPVCANAARAEAPPLMPTRDVSVLYDVTPEGAPQPQAVRVYFRANGAMRIDGPPGPDGASVGDMVVDRAAHTVTVVFNQQRSFMQIPERDDMRAPFVLDPAMRFTRTGTGTQAGLACTQWSIVSDKGDATACVTADGVVLAEQGVDGQGARGRLSARSVQYGPLPAALFIPPPGFERIAHPEGPGPGPGPAPIPGGATGP